MTGPGPVAPFPATGMACPGHTLGPHSTPEEAGNREVHYQGSVVKFADSAVPVTLGLCPWNNDLGLGPRPPPVLRAGDQGLSAVVVVGISLLVEHREKVAVLQTPHCDLVHAVFRMAENDVRLKIAWRHHVFPPGFISRLHRGTQGRPDIAGSGSCRTPRAIMARNSECRLTVPATILTVSSL